MKKTIAILIAITLMLSLMAACGQSDTPSAPDAPQESGGSQDAAPAAPGGDDASAGDGLPTLTGFVLGMEGGVDFTDNYVTQWLREKAGVNLEFTHAVSGDDGRTKLSLLIYSGETLPDVFIATGWTKAETTLYGSEGIVIPLEDYLENAPNWNYLNEVCPGRRGDLTMLDGHIYTYGGLNECFHCKHQARMWIYQPWVDSLNGGVLPSTTEELYDFLKKVKTEDPNGNGIDDEIPFSGFLGGWSSEPFTFISNAFVQNNNIMSNTNPTVAAGFMVNNGRIEYNMLKDAYRDALAYMNRLYSEGLLDSQAYTQNADQNGALLDNEVQLVALQGGGAMPQNEDFWPQQPGRWQNWTILPPLKGPDGVQYAFTGAFSYFENSRGLVSSDCQDPALAVHMFDTLASEEGTLVTSFGVEGITWERISEGTNLVGGPPLYRKLTDVHRRDDNSVDWQAYGYDFKDATWDSDAQISASTAKFRESEGVDDPNMNVEAILHQAALLYNNYAFADNSIVPNMPFTEEQSRRLSDYTVSVGSYANSASIRFITGEMDIDTQWDEYLAEMQRMDVDGYISLMQEAYDAYIRSLG